LSAIAGIVGTRKGGIMACASNRYIVPVPVFPVECSI
jgi:hypothetical protein